MSLILDALNRSERERREAGGMPGLHSVHTAVPEPGDAARRRPRLERWLLLLVVVILSADVLIGRWQDSQGRDGITLGSTAGTHTAASAAPEQRPPDAGSRTGERPAAVADTAATIGAPASRSTSEKAGAGNPEIQALYRGEILAPRTAAAAPTKSKAPSPVAAPADEAVIEELLARAKVAGANAASPYFAVPYITDLPADLRSRIPTLNYSEHRLGGSASEYRVRINGILLAAGESLRSDLVLQGIYPEGIVLNFEGVSFRLEALNRWVNF